MITWEPHASAPLIALLLVAGGVGAWWLHRRLYRRFTPREAVLLVIPKLVVLLALLLALLDPQWRHDAADGQRRALYVLVDQSSSMELADAGAAGAATTRRAQAEAVADAIVAAAPSGITVVRRWFDSSLAAQPTAPGAAPAGTDLGACLQLLARESAASDSVGAIVISDGGDEPVTAEGLPAVPLTTVAVGGERAPLDNLAIVAVQCPESVEKGLGFTCTADISALGAAPFLAAQGAVGVSIEIADQQEWRRIAAVQLDLRQGRARAAFAVKGDAVGPTRWRVRVQPAPGEVSTLDNARVVTVDVAERSLHVLYFTRSLGVDLKQLRAELGRDPGVTLTALYRTVGERFAIQGDRVAGDEDLTAGFPKDAKTLARYDCVILGSFPATAWGGEDQRRLADYVTGGGGLAVLGGDEALGVGGYAGSPLAALIPWQIDADEAKPLRGEFPVRLAAAARGHPVTAGLEIPANAAVASLNRPGSLRPGAQALLEATLGDGAMAVVAAQGYGKGRVLGFATDTLWRMARTGNEAHGVFWRQAVRWLGDKAEGGSALRVSWDRGRYRPGETATARLRAFAPTGQPRFTASVAALAADGAPGPARDLAPEAVAGDPGEAGLAVPFGARGDYLVRVVAELDGGGIATYEKRFAVAPALPEGARLEPDVDGLKRLAESHGGIGVRAAELPRLQAWIADLARARVRQVTASLVTGAPWWLAVVMIALASEWALRRRRNLL